MTPSSTRETFDRRLRQLLDEVLILGSMVEDAILESVSALKKRDQKAAQRIFSNDQRVNEKRYALEQECIVLIATQQPMARDLRMLAAILEITTELERIGDYAKGISRITILLGDDPINDVIADIEHMAEMGLDMLHRALGAFVARDTATAREIPREDDAVDALYNHIFKKLMNRMIENPSVIDHANYLIWSAHNLERLADRVTNICERIVYIETGEMRELDVIDDQNIVRKFDE